MKAAICVCVNVQTRRGYGPGDNKVNEFDEAFGVLCHEADAGSETVAQVPFSGPAFGVACIVWREVGGGSCRHAFAVQCCISARLDWTQLKSLGD